jgi:hypothetical protein
MYTHPLCMPEGDYYCVQPDGAEVAGGLGRSAQQEDRWAPLVFVSEGTQVVSLWFLRGGGGL